MIDKEYLRTLPKGPGVYLMKDEAGTVIYVGKAKSLKTRVGQYFAGSDERPQVAYLVEEVFLIDTISTATEKEALMLENNLIRKLKPKYNILCKDDKSYLCVLLSHHKAPRISLERFKERKKAKGDYFGPYPQSKQARHLFEMACRLFLLRQCSDAEFASRKRPCMLYQIKRCHGPCVGCCEQELYDSEVSRCKRFLHGDVQGLVKEWKQKMNEEAKLLRFEEAGRMKKNIELVESIFEVQGVVRRKIGAADVFALVRQNDSAVIAKLLYRQGVLLESETFVFHPVIGEDSEIVETFLLQHYANQVREIPDEILLTTPCEHTNGVAQFFLEERGKKCLIHVPKRGEGKKCLAIAIVNATHALEKAAKEKQAQQELLIEVEKQLQLTSYPQVIECYDISHLGGNDAIGVRVGFVDGKADKRRYRSYTIQQALGGDDYGSLREVLVRRFTGKHTDALPNLVLIDGGKGQWNTVSEVLHQCNIATVDLVSIAKEGGKHDKGLRREVIFTKEGKIELEPTHSVLQCLQRIRDESHRFAIGLQKKKRVKKVRKSLLAEINGIGPAKQKKLLQVFSSVEEIRKKSVEELESVSGISSADAKNIVQFFNSFKGECR